MEKLTVEEKLRLICGKGAWHTEDFNGKLPSVRVTDASMGVRMPDENGVDKPSCAYPSLQMLANTWNLDTVRKYAQCVADDCLDMGADVILGPGVNIKRSPLCGRNFEYFSEDPYLAGVMAREYVRALQEEGAGACVKHFCANNLEFNRMRQSSEVSERALREIYYKPFETACEAKPISIMCSYNKINGVQGSEYKQGFDMLREEYGFDGMIMSDWDAVVDRARAAKAGLDLEMPFNEAHYEKLIEDYRAGNISEEEINTCAERVLQFILRAKKLHESKKRKYTLQERIAFTQEAEEEGIVLLKNEGGVLPLKKGQKLSACGAFARPCMFHTNNVEMLVGGGSGRVIRLTPPFDMIELLKSELGGEILFEPAFTEDTPWLTDLVGANAKNSDVSLVFAGTGSRVETEGRDREPAMKLFSAIDRVILDVAEANPQTVVVLFAGAPIDMSAWIDKVAAVVWVGFPGEKGGEAIANVLTGKVNPSGKLSETFPIHYEDTPAAKGRISTTETHYEEGVFVGYRYFDTYGEDVLFPFGFGLSYSSFVYRNLKLCAKGGLNLEIGFEIENVSAVDGKEIAEVYVRAIGSSVVRPNKELKAFCKTEVKAGERKIVCVSLGREAFTYWSEAEGKFAVEDCEYEIIIAASSQDERLCAKIKICNGEITVL